MNWKRLCMLVIPAIGMAFQVGCEQPDNDGWYLAEGTTEDIGMRLVDPGCLSDPVKGGPCLPTNMFWGDLWVFPPGSPIPTKHFDFPQSSYRIDGSFSVVATNEFDPSESVTVRGKGETDGSTTYQIVAEIVMSDGTRNLTLPRTEYSNYESYKCWGGYGKCDPVLSDPACTFTRLAPDGPPYVYELTARIGFKDADGNLYGGTAGQGEGFAYYPDGQDNWCFVDLPGSSDACGYTMTTTLSGITAGEIGFHIPIATFEAYGDAIFRVHDPNWRNQHSVFEPQTVGCPQPTPFP